MEKRRASQNPCPPKVATESVNLDNVETLPYEIGESFTTPPPNLVKQAIFTPEKDPSVKQSLGGLLDAAEPALEKVQGEKPNAVDDAQRTDLHGGKPQPQHVMEKNPDEVEQALEISSVDLHGGKPQSQEDEVEQVPEIPSTDLDEENTQSQDLVGQKMDEVEQVPEIPSPNLHDENTQSQDIVMENPDEVEQVPEIPSPVLHDENMQSKDIVVETQDGCESPLPPTPTEPGHGTASAALPEAPGDIDGDLEKQLESEYEKDSVPKIPKEIPKDPVPVVSRVEQFAMKKAQAPKAKGKAKAKSKAKASPKGKAYKKPASAKLGAKPKRQARKKALAEAAEEVEIPDDVPPEQPDLAAHEQDVAEAPSRKRPLGDVLEDSPVEKLKTFARRAVPKRERPRAKWFAIRDIFTESIRPLLSCAPSSMEDCLLLRGCLF